jgi:hypothetical protein
MHELKALLKHRDSDFKFDHHKNCIRCFPHIINICISHIIASSTQVSKKYLKSLKSEGDDGLSYSDDDDDDDNSHNNIALPRKIRRDISKLKLKNFELEKLSAEDQAWFSGMNRDPIKHTRAIVRILRSSDQRKQDFKEVIKNRNKSGWFRGINSFAIVVPNLEPLRDVKTRWVSIYTMIEHLVVLRPVSIPTASCFNHGV